MSYPESESNLPDNAADVSNAKCLLDLYTSSLRFSKFYLLELESDNINASADIPSLVSSEGISWIGCERSGFITVGTSTYIDRITGIDASISLLSLSTCYFANL